MWTGGAPGLASLYLPIADLGLPERFHYMLRVVKPSSPMSVGTWILTAYGPGSGLAAAAELLPPSLRASMPGRLLHPAGRPAGLSATVFAPGVASYTAALLAQTAVPPGTRPAGNCRSYLPGRRRPAVAVSACFSRRSPRRVPRAGWPRPGRRRN